MVKAELLKRLNAQGGKMDLKVTLSIKQGAFVALYGKSGAGKTSVLRMIAGLMKPDEGTLQVDGKFWVDSTQKINLKPQQRQLGFVFQDYALFPNMTVMENLTYALTKGQSKSSIDPLIEMMELGDLRYSKPHTLSGGQQQRVALARALVSRPKLLLMDEPLSALDWEIRKKLQDFIRLVHQEYQLTSIMVSHDLSEVLRLSGYVYVLENGKVKEEGEPNLTLVNGFEKRSPFEKLGEVMSIGTETASVLLDNGVWNVPLPNKEGTQLKVGDKIWLSPESDQVTFNRLA